MLTGYYWKSKKKLQNNTHKRCQNFSEEERTEKCQYGCE